jgi:hypothetical protein
MSNARRHTRGELTWELERNDMWEPVTRTRRTPAGILLDT